MTKTRLAGGIALLMLAGLGCGGSGKSTPGAPGAGGASSVAGGGSGGSGGPGGSVASPGGAGSSSGGSASGGMLTLGDSLTEGCIAYATAVCTRGAECDMRTPNTCIDVAADCPDLIASPGATRTPAGLKACAEVYKTRPCEQIRLGELPDCVTPGLRARGEPCSYSSQCSSLNCKGAYAVTCGKCAFEAGVGESCSADDVDCGPGTYCDGERCVALSPLTPVGPNEACVPTSTCAAGYYCQLNGGSSGVCAPLPPAGQPCTSTFQCATQAFCKEETATCMAYPGPGQPCGLLNDFIPAGYFCATGLLCSGADFNNQEPGTCVPESQLGEPCVTSVDGPRSSGCALALHCNTSAVPPVCAGKGNPGSACAGSFECADGLYCGCPDGNAACQQPTCTAVHYAGEPCTLMDPTSRCHPAFDCQDGVCKPAELRGVFAGACAP